MPTTVELQKMFKYSPWPLTIAAIALAAVTLILIAMILYRIIRNKKEGKKNTIKAILWTRPDLEKLKQEYLARLNHIEMDFDSDKTQIRAAYEKMSQKIENISENRDLILMDDGSVYLCGKMPGREQVFIIEVAGLTDNEEGRERLLRIAEKLGL